MNYTVIAKNNIAIDVWLSGRERAVGIQIAQSPAHLAMAYITPDQVDELIRALAAARVELSKESPK